MTFATDMTPRMPALHSAAARSGALIISTAVASLAGSFIYVWTAVPETKGYSLEEIGRIWLQSGERRQ